LQPINSKQSFTRDCAFLALIRLMQTKPLSSISVTELTKKAGISRTAFYNNYSSVENVIVKYFDSCVDSIIGSAVSTTGNHVAIKVLVSDYFEWLSDNEFLMRNLLTTDNMVLFTTWLKDCFHGRLSGLVKSLGFLSDFEVSSCAGMFCEITRDWISSGMDSRTRKQAEGALYRLLYIYQQSIDKSSVHYTSPQHLGKLQQYNGVGSFRFVDTGETITVYMLVEHDQIVSCSAEVVTIPGKEAILKAAANAVCAYVCSKPTVSAMSITADDVSRELNGLSSEFMYCAAVAASAAKNAAIDFYNRLSLARCLVGEEESITTIEVV